MQNFCCAANTMKTIILCQRKQGSQPLVMVLGRAMYKNLPEIYQTALLQNRLLIVSVAPSTLRHSTQSAFKRNKYIIENVHY